MRAAQLYIKDTGKYIQLGQGGDFPFTLNKSIAEVQNVSKRNKTYSKTFKIPATEDNIKALGYPHVIGTDLDAVKNLRQACYVIVNGNVLEEGAVYVVSATSDLDVRQFDCVFIGGDEIWTEPLRTLKMSDLVTESVAYTDAALETSFASFTAGTDYIRWVNPYMYKFSDGQSPSATGDDFWLAYRVDKLIIRMVGEAALGLALQGLPYFQLDSVFIEQNDTGASHGFWDYIFWSDRSRGEYDVSFPNTLNGVAGGNIQIGEFFPTDVTALDFLLGFVRTFNCVMQWNNDTSTLKIEPRFDWESWDGTTYSGFYGTDVDWSEKISKANTVQYSLPYKRFIQLNYIADPNDSNNELLYGGKKELEDDRPSGDLSTAANYPDRRYFVDTGNINEDGASVIDMYYHPSNPNLFSESFKKNFNASAFSLTPAFNNRFVKYDQIDFNHPNVFANRLFIYTRSDASDFTTGLNQWDDWRYTEDDGTTTVDYSDYPVMYTFGIFDDADGGTDVFNLGVFNNFSTLYTGGLYERFWKSTLDTFSTTRLLKAQILMTRSEYIALDISNYFTALGQRFILNKIKDFDPMLDEQMVEVELLAVDAFRSSEEVTPLLLDLYGEDNRVAYSVRKLRTAYTGNCMRVRNGSSVELDIGFDSSGNLDESALLTHCGSGDGYVTIWYDQSGNGYNMVQATTSRQPLIVSSGAVIKENGKPTLFKDTTSQFMQTTAINVVNTSTGAFTALGVGKYSSSYRSHFLGHDSATTTKRVAQFLRNGHTSAAEKLRIVVFSSSAGNTGTTITQIDTSANSAYIGNQILQGATSEGDTTKALAIRYNGSNVQTGTYTLLQNKTANELTLFDTGRNSPGDSPDTYCQEIICYQANKSDIADIESNINTYFTIYS
jgi:hypothetical protein